MTVALVAPVVLGRLWEFRSSRCCRWAAADRVPPRRRFTSARGYGSARLGWCSPSARGHYSPSRSTERHPDDLGEVARARNFYGVLTVLDDDADSTPVLRRLRNGRILHGAQFLDPEHKTDVTTYYGEGSGVEVAIDRHPKREAAQPLRIGVIGLGAGTMAGLGQHGDTVHFFEINPAAVDFARRYFTFLSDARRDGRDHAGRRAAVARTRASRSVPRHGYDVLAIDAFSGDAIPVHLLTREAFALYREALQEDGVLAVHVSNHYLDLPPIVRGLAAEQGRQVALIETDDDEPRALDSSTWMLVPNNARLLENAGASIRPPEPGERDRRLDRRVQQPARGDKTVTLAIDDCRLQIGDSRTAD